MVICEFCYILQKMFRKRVNCVPVYDVLPGWKFCVQSYLALKSLKKLF